MKAPAEERGDAPARRAAPPRAVADPEPAIGVREPGARPLSRAAVQRLQSGAGNRAVSALVAQRRAASARTPAAKRPGAGGGGRGPAASVPAQRSAAAPSAATCGAPAPAGPVEAGPVQRLATDAGPLHRPGPQADPKFAALKADVRGKQQVLGAHPPAAAEASKAQGAAKAPQDDKEAQGKAANAEKMNAAKPGEFDKAAFVRAVNEAIAAQAPKNLDEAKKFGDSGKADAVKGQVQGQVTDGKKTSASAIETTTKAPPDTSQAKDKQVVPLVADKPPATPGTPDPAKAVPDKAPPAATDFSAGPKQVDQQMADAQVTDEQLAKSNEPEFTGALKEKTAVEQHAQTAPGQVRAAETQTLTGAKAAAGAAGATAMTALAGSRKQAGAQVGAGKEQAKGADESKRAQATAKLQTVFDATKSDVEEILSGLDKKVDEKFTAGEKAARDGFTADYQRRIDDYKDKRYSGPFGWAKWGKDKLLGLPDEVNAFYDQARKGYVDRMQQVISGVADVIGAELTRAKQRITTGRDQLQAEVRKLPADLQAIGKEAAGEFAGKFDELTESVNSKGTELVQTLASKYNEALKSVDEEIAAEKEKNKGLVAKAVDAVAGVIKTIMQLKDMLMGVLAKAAQAVMAIIKDPIGFLGNLVSAVGAGLKQFLANIGEHLKKGLVGWLTGAMAGAGLELPAKFDLRGIVMMVGSLLGLTWASIRGLIIKRGVPEPAMSVVEKSVPLVQKVQAQGLGGLWEEIQDKVGDLKANLFSKISEYLIPTVLMAGITWIISLLNPASAFVRAVKMIIDFVTFIVTQGAQILEFVNSVLDAIIAIAGGGTGGVPALIEKALARSVPVLIGVLAAVLGVGGIAQRVQKFFKSLSAPVMKAVHWVADKIAAIGRKLWAKVRNRRQKKASDRGGPGGDRSALALRAAVSLVKPGIAVPEIKKKLPAIRKKYELKQLTLITDTVEQDKTLIHFRAVNSPGVDSEQVTVPGDESNKEKLDEIKAAMPAHVDRFVGTVHEFWWKTYISKVRRGTDEGSSPLWTKDDIRNTDGEARSKATAPEFIRPLVTYFDSNRKRADTTPFYEYVFQNSGSAAKRAVLQELGTPVPDRLKTEGLARVPALEAEQGYKDRLTKGLQKLGPTSYKVDVLPYGQLNLPTPRPTEHSDFFPTNIKVTDDGTKRITTYTTLAGKSFQVVESDALRSMSLRVKGIDLRLKTGGGPRGVTQDSPGFVTNMNLNRAHGIADMFGGSGFEEARNLVTTSDHYNQVVMSEVETAIANRIKLFARTHQRETEDVALNLTVTVRFGELVSELLKQRITHQPWYQAGDAEATKRLQEMLKIMLNPPIRRAAEVIYEYEIVSGENSIKDRARIGADEWLFVEREAG
ncbi:hypothetical protein ABT023_23780 [Micromonospora sp. NPDC002296]|uniref:hypothetical protein n=1 Tax=Micromonospora sp. NPDC002296 TaxID=3154271 RepID=UPI0033338661